MVDASSPGMNGNSWTRGSPKSEATSQGSERARRVPALMPALFQPSRGESSFPSIKLSHACMLNMGANRELEAGRAKHLSLN